MNVEDVLADDAAREHQNPLAGRSQEIERAARLRRARRTATFGGVGLAAVIAVGLLVFDLAPNGPTSATPPPAAPTDPETSTGQVSTDAGPTAPTEVCGLTVDDLRPEGPGDVRVSTAYVGGLGGDLLGLTLTLGTVADDVRQVRSSGNEVFEVDAMTGRVLAYAGDPGNGADGQVVPGVPFLVDERVALAPCADAADPDGVTLLYVRGEVMGSTPWFSGAVQVPPEYRSPGVDAPEDHRAVAFEPISTTPPSSLRSTGIALTGEVAPGPYSGSWDAYDTLRTSMTVTNTTSARLTAPVWPWVVLVRTSGESSPESVATTPPFENLVTLDLAPGESVEIPVVQALDEAVGDHRLPDQPLVPPGSYDAYVVLVDAASYPSGLDVPISGWAASEVFEVVID